MRNVAMPLRRGEGVSHCETEEGETMPILNLNAKSEYHLHLDGSITERMYRRISEETGQKIPEDYKSKMKYDSASGTLVDYLKCFELPLSFMQSPENVRYCVMALQEDLVNEGLNYAEIRFAPQLHLAKDENGKAKYTQKEVVQAACEGLEYGALMGIETKLILCMMRGGNDKDNEETVDAAKEFFGKGVVMLDLAGDEAGYPVMLYSELFGYAKKHNIPFTIHAGEAAGPESIENALKLGAKRIGHGLAAAEDKTLMKYLAEHKIMLEMCPTSNIQTGAVKRLALALAGSSREIDSMTAEELFYEYYPLRKFEEAGIDVSINTDNRVVSGTTLKNELDLIKKF